MNLNRTRFCFLLVLVAGIYACSSTNNIGKKKHSSSFSYLEKGFFSPADNIQTSVYWYWISDNISKEGVIKDLHAMKKVGINRAFIGNIGINEIPYGKVKLFSEEWWDILHTALKTATELNIEIGIFNSPGWSQSGGPWIKPEQSMRFLSSSETIVKGGRLLNQKLQKPEDQFQDVKVIAYELPKEFRNTIASLNPSLITSRKIDHVYHLMDGDLTAGVDIPAKESFNLDIKTNKDFTVRSIVIHPAHKALRAEAKLQVEGKNGYETITSFVIDRSNDNLHVGFVPYGPVVISIPATTSKSFRMVFHGGTDGFSLAELELSSSPKVESYIEKSLAKMYQSPLPYWQEYQWKSQPVIEDTAFVIDPKKVIDISKFMDAEGLLKWDAPEGDWVVMRTGMSPTKVKNAPASPEGTGLEVDKMSKLHVASHFDAFLGEILRRIPAKDRKTWKVAVEDSYETGGQNWTDGMLDKFKLNYGYDPLPYLPVLNGNVVGSQDMSDRFLWDLRRFIADRVAYDYVGGLREVSNKNGLTTWLENYGHWGFPGEFLKYGGQSDEIAGEFWSEGELGNIENKAASSAAHIYGKAKVSAESFTAAGKPFARYPEVMKQRGDRFFTEGINNSLLHVFIQQPDERLPGVNAWFGNEFNRHNTWFNYMDLFTSYLKRCNFMLQQGKYVADVAYFIGEDAPKMTGVTDPALPAGYSFDYINAEVLMNRVKVKNNKLVLSDGMTYSMLVLPKLETMRPELLEKIRDLVKEGATILGPAPLRSPSLKGYPSADAKVKQIALELWGDIDGKTNKKRAFGKGLVFLGMDMQTALNSLNIIPDCDIPSNPSLLYIHRTTDEGEIYFLSNQSEQAVDIAPSFRITGKQPELWDATTGGMRMLKQFSQTNHSTKVPLALAPLQSAFIVFRKNAEDKAGEGINFPQPELFSSITQNWNVTFDADMRGPQQPVVFKKLNDWTESTNENIKYYSGTAIYRNSFEALKSAQANQRIYLNLGEVKVMAKVKINGMDVGGAWTAPWQVDITKAVRQGKNDVEISVVNTWVNRLIGDSRLLPANRKTWTFVNPYTPESTLEPSGLKGPVTVTSVIFQ